MLSIHELLVAPRTQTIWAPQKGSQVSYLTCPIFEVLYEGTRGPGKTDCLLMDFAQHVGKGYGSEWRGIIFRQTYPQLQDLIAKGLKWFPQFFPGAKYNKVNACWTWPTGEVLYFRQMASPIDYWNYHGHAYPFIGFEELTSWPDDRCYKVMMSCCRSTMPGMPRKYRSTTNPYGVGHNWVKARWRLPAMRGKVIRDALDEDGKPEPERVAIHGTIWENQILLTADPEYIQKIRASAENDAQLKAWLYGSWDVVAGGMFDDVWSPEHHVVEPFDLPLSWRLDRSFDWGSSHPFSVGWWAESDGSDVQLRNGTWRSTVRGDLFRFAEWYGWNGKKRNVGSKLLPDAISAGIIERELGWGLFGRVRAGPADSAIFDNSTGHSVAKDLEAKVRVKGKEYRGTVWHPADKSPGSRIRGWHAVRQRLKAGVPPKAGVREHPGLFVFSTCTEFINTFPVLPRHEKNMDDVDTKAEDHIGDEVRYRCYNPALRAGHGTAKGDV